MIRKGAMAFGRANLHRLRRVLGELAAGQALPKETAEMQWTAPGAHLLQTRTRTKTLNGELATKFREWYHQIRHSLRPSSKDQKPEPAAGQGRAQGDRCQGILEAMEGSGLVWLRRA